MTRSDCVDAGVGICDGMVGDAEAAKDIVQ